MSDDGAEGHVFISYVREDKHDVDRLQRLLEAAGVRVWRDTGALWAGEDWRLKIREAITTNSLAFVACFSDNSEQKESSYQREELVLAIDQLRRRNPAKAWLVPVRFSDCDLPPYEIGPGKHLSDLNWVSLFGDQWETESAKLVASVLRILRPSEPPATTSPAAAPETVVKGALLDPARQIELEDFVMERANLVARSVSDQAFDAFPVTPPGPMSEDEFLRFVVQQVHRYCEALDPLLRSLIPGAAWGQPHHEGIWTRAVERVANTAAEAREGWTALLELRRFPMLPMLYAVGIAAVHRRNYGALRAVAIDAQYRSESGQIPLIGAAHIWRPFSRTPVAANLMSYEATGSEITDDFIRGLQERTIGPRHTPVSEFLRLKLRPIFENVVPDDEDFTVVFDRLEVTLGALAVDAKKQALGSGAYLDGPWFGSFTWRYRSYDTEKKLEARVLAELEQQGEESAMLRGGLFGGDLSRALTSFREFRDAVAARPAAY